MPFVRYLCVVALTCLASACVTARDKQLQRDQNDGGQAMWMQAGALRLKVVYFAPPPDQRGDHLVLFLHGDLYNPPINYRFLSTLSTADSSAVYVELLRPGYVDRAGDRSGGERGLAVGDNYTPEIVDAIDALCVQLKRRFRVNTVILVGHSGGATLAADLIGRYPGIAAGAELIACGCDPVEWRARRALETGDSVWSKPVRSLDPLQPPRGDLNELEVRMLVGAQDEVVGAAASEKYAVALRSWKAHVQLIVLSDRGHNDITASPEVVTQLRELINDTTLEE